nr:HAMP domain-containing histidine kinase [Saprospiraceae bacterium]
MNQKLRLLSYVVIAYMLLAFAWWTILLNTKNEEAYTAKKESLKISMMVDGTYTTEAEFIQTEKYTALKDRYKRRQLMIFGESLVFVISLFIGFWLINKGYRDIIKNSKNKTNFLLSISHELKSPVASVRLALETLIKRDLEKSQLKKISAGALKENTRLGALIENLLLAAKLEESYEINREVVRVADIILPIVNNEKLKYPSAEIQINIDDSVKLIHTDKFALHTILNNLIENALKYSPGIKRVLIQFKAADNDLLIEVGDQGVGIPKEEKERVFDKFYRLGAEITRTTKGTGLGLFIISKMVKALGGNIAVKDNDPRGSVFIVKLKNQVVKQFQ